MSRATNIQIRRGRSYELDRTTAGTATVTLKDADGVFDPTNTTGTYYGQLQPLKPARIQITNPVTNAVETLFRGHTQDWSLSMDVSGNFSTVTLSLVDAFDILAALEMTPESQGDVAPTQSAGDIYFEGKGGDQGGTTDNVLPSDRIVKVLDDVGWPGTGLKISLANLRNIFSGNVALQDAVYARRDSALTVIFDAADADFPGVANVFIDKSGVFTFHGRFARFDPNNYGTYGIVTWNAGDIIAADADPANVAVISGIEFNRGSTNLFNSAIALPQGVDDTDVPASLVTDTASITDYGLRSISFPDLLVYKGEEQSGRLSAVAETKLVATYYVDNYAQPRNRVSRITFRTQDPNGTYGPAWWALVLGVDLGHVINLTTTHPGGGGFNEAFFVEGITYTITPLSATYPDITLELDLSPQAYYTQQPFTPDSAFAPAPTVSRAPHIAPLTRGP